jgi:hypothetical protein
VHVAAVRVELRRLDDDAFATATEQGSIAALRKYLDDYPRGTHAAKALKLITEARVRTDWTRLLVSIRDLEVQPPVRVRASVEVVVIDQGAHAQSVTRIVREAYDGPVSFLDLSTMTYFGALATIVERKKEDPGRDFVVNLSWAWEPAARNEIEESIYWLFLQAGIVIVAAAGNDGEELIRYPAAHEAVIAVGAVTPRLQLTRYSNFGRALNFCAVDSSEEELDTFVAELRTRMTYDRECQQALGLLHDPERLSDLAVLLDQRTHEVRSWLERKIQALTSESGTSFAAPVVSAYIARAMRRDAGLNIQAVLGEVRRRSSFNGKCFVLPWDSQLYKYFRPLRALREAMNEGRSLDERDACSELVHTLRWR